MINNSWGVGEVIPYIGYRKGVALVPENFFEQKDFRNKEDMITLTFPDKEEIRRNVYYFLAVPEESLPDGKLNYFWSKKKFYSPLISKTIIALPFPFVEYYNVEGERVLFRTDYYSKLY